MSDKRLRDEVHERALLQAAHAPPPNKLPCRSAVKCPRCHQWCSPEQVKRFGYCSRVHWI